MKISELLTHSFQNREEIKVSISCGCFHCFCIFTPSEIKYWSDSDDPEDEYPGALRTDSETYQGKTAISRAVNTIQLLAMLLGLR